MAAETKRIAIAHYIVVFLFCMFFRFVPGFAGITPYGMGILGCFIGAIYGWLFIDMLWPSIIALLGLGLTVGMNDMLAASFGSSTVVALILCMGVVGVAIKTGAFEWLVKKLLARKGLQGKPWRIIFLVFILAWLFGATQPIILMIVFGAFIVTILKECGVPKNDKLALTFLLGVPMCLMMGQIMFPFFSTGLVFIGAYARMFPEMPLNMISYLLFMFIIGILMIAVYVGAMKFVFRVNVRPLAEYVPSTSSTKATHDQRIGLILFFLFILINLIAALPFGRVLNLAGIVGFCILFSALVPIIRSDSGGALGNLEELLHMVNWGQITMVAFIMAISSFINSEDAGITAAMGGIFTPFMSLSPYVFIIIAIILAVVLTNFANNMIITVMVLPLLVNYAATAGIAPSSVVLLLFLAAQFALLTPAASPITAIAFSNEMVESRSMTKTALVAVPIVTIAFLIIGLPLSQFIISAMG